VCAAAIKVVLKEEAEHHRYVVRDLTLIESRP